jgi:hypothetical protein
MIYQGAQLVDSKLYAELGTLKFEASTTQSDLSGSFSTCAIEYNSINLANLEVYNSNPKYMVAKTELERSTLNT